MVLLPSATASCCTRSLRLSESRGNACIHFAECEQARSEVNLGEAHIKHAYQLMANELKIGHVKVSLLYMAMQLVVSLGFIYVCPLIVDKFAQEGPFWVVVVWW